LGGWGSPRAHRGSVLGNRALDGLRHGLVQPWYGGCSAEEVVGAPLTADLDRRGPHRSAGADPTKTSPLPLPRPATRSTRTTGEFHSAPCIGRDRDSKMGQLKKNRTARESRRSERDGQRRVGPTFGREPGGNPPRRCCPPRGIHRSIARPSDRRPSSLNWAEPFQPATPRPRVGRAFPRL